MSVYVKIIYTLLPCIVLGQFSSYPSIPETSTSQYDEFTAEPTEPATTEAESLEDITEAGKEDFDLGTESYHSTTRILVTSESPVGTTGSSDYASSTLDYQTTHPWQEFSTNAPDSEESTNSPEDSVPDMDGSYGTQVPWNSVSSPSPSLPREMSIQTQGSNSSDTIDGSAWQYQGSLGINGSSFRQNGNFSNTNPSRNTNPKPACKNGLKYAKKISEIWRSCELATRLWNVSDISNKKSPCFAKCLMNKMKLISSDASIRERDVRTKFQQDGPFKGKVNSLQAMIWEECVLQINRITKDIYSRIDSSCDHHATFLTCGLQKMTQNCSLRIDNRNLTFITSNTSPTFAIQILEPQTV